MEPESAAETLQEIERVRTKTRAKLRTFWFPLLVFGSLTVASTAVIVLAGAPAVGVYWAVAAPLGAIVTRRYYQRRENALGLEGRGAPYVATGIGMMVGCFLAGALGEELVSSVMAMVGPSLVVSAGYLVFAYLDGSFPLAGVAVALAAAALGLQATDLDAEQVGVLLAVGYGGASLALAIVYRAAESHHQGMRAFRAREEQLAGGHRRRA